MEREPREHSRRGRNELVMLMHVMFPKDEEEEEDQRRTHSEYVIKIITKLVYACT